MKARFAPAAFLAFVIASLFAAQDHANQVVRTGLVIGILHGRRNLVIGLSDHISHRRLAVFIAHVGTDLAGLATTVALPASLRLECSWQLRDLYVVPGARRRGVARALVGAVRQAATAAGAIRLSVQTEPSNIAALQLYRTGGFVPIDDIQILALPL